MPFQRQRVRTSTRFYSSFILTMGRSLGFGSNSCNLFALLRLGFPSATYLTQYLTLPYTITRWTVLQKVRYRTKNVLYLLVNIGFQVLFHSPPGVLFTFPSRYFSTIGHQGVFRLGRWSSLLQTGFLVSRPTLDTDALTYISLTGLSPSSVLLPSRLQIYSIVTSSVLNPE